MKKRIFLSVLFSLAWIFVFATVNAFRGTTNSNWGTNTNWTQNTVPTNADGFVTTFDASSPNCTLNVTGNCQSLDFTGFTNILAMGTNGLTATSGTITFQAGQSSRITGSTGSLTLANTTSITANGGTWPLALLSSVSSTKTLTGTLTVTGLFTCSTTTQTWTGGTLICNGGITLTGAMSGTCAVTLGGGTLQGAGIQSCAMTFSGTNTVSGSVTLNGGITATSSTTTTTGSTVTITASSTINTGSIITWNNITFNATTTFTLGSALNLSGTLSLSLSPTFSGAFDISCGNLSVNSSGGTVTMSGNITSSGTISSGGATATIFNGAFNVNATGSVSIGTNWSGTATLNYTGTGTFQGATGASILAMNTTINTAGATFGSFTYRTNTLTWTAIGTSTFGSMTLALNTAPTMTVNCTVLTINGSQGFTITNYSAVPGAATKVTWQANNTYTISSSILITTTLALTHTWVSSSPATQYKVTLTNGATCDVGFATVTDCDSSQGATVWNYKGTDSNTKNWNILPTQPATVGATFTN